MGSQNQWEFAGSVISGVQTPACFTPAQGRRWGDVLGTNGLWWSCYGSVPQRARGPAAMPSPGALGFISSPTTRPWRNSLPSWGASAAKQKGHRAACSGETGTCCGFSLACLRARIAPSSRNRLSTLQTGFSHNPECITEKLNNKHILVLNSWAPSASDLPDGPCSGKGWLAFLQPL